MEERIIDTVAASTLVKGDRIDAFLDGNVWEIVEVIDGDAIVVILEDNPTAEEVVMSHDEQVSLYGY